MRGRTEDSEQVKCVHFSREGGGVTKFWSGCSPQKGLQETLPVGFSNLDLTPRGRFDSPTLLNMLRIIVAGDVIDCATLSLLWGHILRIQQAWTSCFGAATWDLNMRAKISVCDQDLQQQVEMS